MFIIPAIDLKDGRCVRLRQGDMEQETRYSDDPPAMALYWQAQGAECLHLVDLDGAVEGTPKNVRHIESIVQSLSIPVQVGGGIRGLETIRRYRSVGVERVVLGTAALEDKELLAKACEEFPDHIMVGIDVRHGQVATRGWKDVSKISPEQLIQSLSNYALGGIIFTDISRDGMLTGPNLGALESMAAISPFPLIASGGVTKVEDIQSIGSLGPKIMGIIIGKALYEGSIDLKTAMQVADSSLPKSSPC